MILKKSFLKSSLMMITFMLMMSSRAMASANRIQEVLQEEPDINQGVEERPIGGLGIYLVKQIMDEVYYERKNNKNILTLIKKL